MEVPTGGGSDGGRGRRSLTDENIDNPNLRDFLRVKQDGDDSQTSSSVTLGTVLTETRPAAQPIPTRTLFDIIRDDPTSHHGNRKTWKVFRDKLRLRRAGAAWTSSVRVPASDVPIPTANRMMLRRQSTRFPTPPIDPDPDPESTRQPPDSTNDSMDPLESTQTGPEISRSSLSSLPSNRAMMMRHNSARIPSLTTPYGREPERLQTFNTARSIVQMADQSIEQQQQQQETEVENEEDEGESEEGEEGDSEEEPQVRMSLMDLLADGSPFIMGDDDDEDEDEEEEEVSSGVGESNCCVCMVRHKGAAFIPCGHTFCRMCSRELWVQRGSCPLCNNFILEILDIF